MTDYRTTEPKPLEAPMESPLNLAHTFSRRADMLSKNKKYDEAISCHRKAAEYLSEAMLQTNNSVGVQESLALQHKAYLSEISRLQRKNQLLQLMDTNDKTSSVISQATQTDSISNMNTLNGSAMDESYIYEILRENGELVESFGLKTIKDKGQILSANVKRNRTGDKQDFVSGKVPVNEVVRMNQKLNQAVLYLLNELESTQAEKRQMAKKIVETADIVHQGLEEELTFHSLDLPPLEVSYPELAISEN